MHRTPNLHILQKFLVNQIAANEIIIVKTPYCPSPQRLLQEWVKLLSLKLWWIKMSWITNFLRNYSQTPYSDVKRCTSKWTLGHRRKKSGEGGITPRLPFHYPIFFLYQTWQEITFFRQYSSYFLVQMNCLRNTARQIVTIWI